MCIRDRQNTHKDKYLRMERRLKVAERAALVAREAQARAERALQEARGLDMVVEAEKGGFGTALKELDLTVQMRMNPMDLDKAGAIVRNMKDAGYSSKHINAVCRAIFLDRDDEDLKLAFQVFDTTGEQSVTVMEFRSAMSLMAPDIPEDELDMMFAEADADGSGDIDFEEFVEFMAVLGNRKPNAVGLAINAVSKLQISTQMGMHTSQLPRAGRVIARMEESGYEPAEINDVCAVLFLDPTPEQLESAWTVFDISGTGLVNALHFREAMRLMGEQEEDGFEDKLDELFLEADADGSGEIDFEEFTMLMSRMNAAKEELGSPVVSAISTLGFGVQLRIGPATLAKAGRMVQRLQLLGVDEGMISAACSTFLGDFDKDAVQLLWCHLDHREESTIEVTEFVKILRIAGSELEPETLDQCLDAVQQSGGASERIDFQEFQTLLKAIHPRFHEASLHEGSSSWVGALPVVGSLF
eukprot:TRINITY_DN27711_c0_g1_i1.p1 TRINITY_DN27711_c0_g1~~TRINITY_DN27711_c0_g1_i1.p1  ORF type:complete len:471 (-),score=102.72 TRINITY_DN27711_c0_g1_i1:175-1587(-)